MKNLAITVNDTGSRSSLEALQAIHGGKLQYRGPYFAQGFALVFPSEKEKNVAALSIPQVLADEAVVHAVREYAFYS